ncbi:nucleoside deaminase [Parvibaculum sp.]|uniref:nucleoside deaminase n=1 Tax=Parvibaculum sp. TaxID=2024848 RepID=UPI0032113119
MQQAWLACRAHSLPIGAVLADRTGRVIAGGHNLRLSDHSAHPLAGSAVAHAEIITLGAVKHKSGLNNYVLYTTLEPCPMCAGAIRMAGIGRVCFASRDPFAGGMNLFDTSHFMRGHPCEIEPPKSALLEELLIALLVERLIKLAPQGVGQSVSRWSEVSPRAVAFGQWLAQRGIVDDMCSKNLSAETSMGILEQLYPKVLKPTDAWSSDGQ